MTPSASGNARWKIPDIQSMVGNELQKMHSIPFIVLTETWLKSYISDAQLHIPGYEISRCDREKRIGGGVALFSHHNLPMSESATFDDGICQALFCKFDTIKLCLAIVYRPPESSSASFSSTIEFLSHQFNSVNDDSFEMCLAGDFNFPIIDWLSNTLKPGGTLEEQSSANLLLRFMSNQLLGQFVLVPTRKNNILDLFMTSNDRFISSVSSNPTDLSDHNLVDIMLSFNPLSLEQHQSHISSFEPDTFQSLNFQKADFDRIREMLANVNWGDLRDICTFEEFPILFTQIVLQICIICTPVKKAHSGKPRALNALRRKKNRLQARLKALEQRKTSPQEHINNVHNQLALICYDIKDAINRNLDWKELQAVQKIKNNPKFFYSYAKSKSQVRTNIGMLFNTSGDVVTDRKGMCDILQDQFISVFSDPNCPDAKEPDFLPPEIQKPFSEYDLDISQEDILSAIGDIKPDAASGPDGIPVIFLKACANELCEPIRLIWSESFSTGTVPEFYKESVITPLFKKGDRARAINYRPVSLTSHIVKIYERVLRKVIITYLEDNDILCHNQHGFRSGRSCLTQMLGHFDNILTGITDNHDTDAIYLDYAKAFDKVDHRLLLAKLEKYKFSPQFIKWVQSFLTNRPQKVVLNGLHSYIATILSGVPQGTVLGPILFILFINDMDTCVKHSTIRFFADDTRISKQISSEADVELLQNDLNNVVAWSKSNNMLLHEDKFELIVHKHRPTSSIYELPFVSEQMMYEISNGELITPVDVLKDLGVTVSSDLSWSTHISSITMRARSVAAWVFSVFRARDTTTMLTLYKSLVRCHLEYCCPLWHPSLISDIKLIEGVQRTFTSKISGVQHLNYWKRLQALGLMSLQRRRERFIIIQVWKILHNQCPNDVNIVFNAPSRHGITAKVPAINKSSSNRNKSLYDSSFAVLGPQLWNCLPGHLHDVAVLDGFKQELTKFLLTFPDNPPVSGYVAVNNNSVLQWCKNKAEALLLGQSQMMMTQ